MARPRRRDVLGAMALALGGVPLRGHAAIINGALPWVPDNTAQPLEPSSREAALLTPPDLSL